MSKLSYNTFLWKNPTIKPVSIITVQLCSCTLPTQVKLQGWPTLPSALGRLLSLVCHVASSPLSGPQSPTSVISNQALPKPAAFWYQSILVHDCLTATVMSRYPGDLFLMFFIHACNAFDHIHVSTLEILNM